MAESLLDQNKKQIQAEGSLLKQNKYEKFPRGKFPLQIFYFPDQAYSFYHHWHEYTEIQFILEGSMRVKYGETYYDLKKDDCLIINSNELHCGAEGHGSYICLDIPPSFFLDNYVIFKPVIHDEKVKELIKSILDCYLSNTSVDMLEIRGYTSLLIGHLIRNHTVLTLTETSYSNYMKKYGKICSAISYIENHFSEKITVKKLADFVHYNSSYFGQAFKEITGKTPIEYINSFRIDKAEQMILSTILPLGEIASNCGFDDLNYFSRMFKKLKGKSPQSLRKE